MATDGQQTSPGRVLDMVVKHRAALCYIGEGVHNREKLAKRLGVSEKTVYRHLQPLRDIGLLKLQSAEYKLTTIGSFFTEFLLDFEATAAQLWDSRDLLEQLVSIHRPPYWLFADAEISHTSVETASAQREQLRSFISGSSTLVAISPHLFPEYTVIIECVVSSELNCNIQLGPEALDCFYSDLCEAVQSEVPSQVQLSSLSDELSFGILFRKAPDPSVLVLIYGPDKRLYGIAHNTEPVAIDWAREFCNTLHSNNMISPRSTASRFGNESNMD